MGDERANKVLDHTRAGNGGCSLSAIAKQKKVFGVRVPHKKIKSHVSRAKKLLAACEPHFAHP